MEVYVSQMINGLSLGSIFLLIALGLNITFGMMGVINFAHGEFLMVGAYTTFLMQSVILPANHDLAFFIAIPVAFCVSGVLGWVTERLLIRHLYGNPFEGILATWGLSLILQQAARNIFGAPNVEVSTPAFLQGGLVIFDKVEVPAARLFIFVVACLALAGMAWFIYRTRQGRQIQAVMQSRPMAGAMGINTKRIDTMTFFLGSGLAGVAGSMVTLLGSIGSSTGQNYIVDSFLVVVLGGVGSLAGTVVGSAMMGFASPFLEYFTNASMGKVLLFIFIILFLTYRSEGLIPRKTRALD